MQQIVLRPRQVEMVDWPLGLSQGVVILSGRPLALFLFGHREVVKI